MDRLFLIDSSEQQFSRARQRALAWQIVRRIRRQPASLLRFGDVYRGLLIRGQRDGGIQYVPVTQIVGSLQRCQDFDRQFLPQTDLTADRWKRVHAAQCADRALPPVELYRLGTICFVADGHHRISVARHRGQVEIEAHVIEVQTDVRLMPDLDMADLPYKEEQSDFYEWTDLARLRPGNEIEVSNLGGYLELIASINRHQAARRSLRGEQLMRSEVIIHWYDTVYLPATQVIRQYELRRHFPRQTVADLFISLTRHQALLAEGAVEVPRLADAAIDYLLHYGSLPTRWRIRQRYPAHVSTYCHRYRRAQPFGSVLRRRR